jgi:TPR repeat protein
MRFIFTLAFIAFFALPAPAADKIDVFETPVDVITKEAAAGNPAAENALGLIYAEGLRGYTMNDAESVKWYMKAALQGYAKAQINLGGMYARGKGVPKDAEEAYFWFLLAEKSGAPPAFAPMLEEGKRKLTAAQIAAVKKRADAWMAKSSVAQPIKPVVP